jgi:tRNA modification GTPase
LCIGLIQGPLDFPIETEEAEINIPQIKKGISEVLPKIETLIKQAHSASILRQGIKAVILGRPNVGKSSLLNLLLSEERAIVSEEAGTTRDFLSEEILIRDIPVKIIDTAGLRDNTESQIEQKGIEKAISLSKQADLILFVYDLIDGWTQEDNNLFDSIKGNNPFAKFVILANKADIANNIYQTEEHSIGKGDKQSKYKENEIKFSTKNSMGLNRLEERIQEILQINSLDGEFEIGINQRQFFLLSSVKESLVKSIEILELKNKSNIAHPTSKGQQVSRINQEPSNLNCETFAEVISIELEEAIKRLGEVIGEKGSITESAVQRVFSNFCIGK